MISGCITITFMWVESKQCTATIFQPFCRGVFPPISVPVTRATAS